MDNQALGAIIGGLLASGCGGANQLILAQLIKWKDEDGQPIAPKTKRRLSLLLAFATPSLLYGFTVWMGLVQYGIAAHIAYMGLAFAAHQALHGETKLATGEEVKAEKATEAYVGKIPRGHFPYEGAVDAMVASGVDLSTIAPVNTSNLAAGMSGNIDLPHANTTSNASYVAPIAPAAPRLDPNHYDGDDGDVQPFPDGERGPSGGL